PPESVDGAACERHRIAERIGVSLLFDAALALPFLGDVFLGWQWCPNDVSACDEAAVAIRDRNPDGRSGLGEIGDPIPLDDGCFEQAAHGRQTLMMRRSHLW